MDKRETMVRGSNSQSYTYSLSCYTLYIHYTVGGVDVIVVVSQVSTVIPAAPSLKDAERQ